MVNYWAIADRFDDRGFTPEQRWVARHEAAHFVAGVFYELPIAGVWLAQASNKSGRLGSVSIFQEPGRGYLVSTAVGTVADLRMHSHEKLRDDNGFHAELRQLRDEVKAAMLDPWDRVYYLHGRAPNGYEVKDAMRSLLYEANDLLEMHWHVVERVARYFLAHVNKHTGKLASGKLYAAKTETQRMLQATPISCC